MQTPGSGPSLAAHWSSVEHGMHECMFVSQIGFAGLDVQSAVVAHSTHVTPKHTGVLPEHTGQCGESLAPSSFPPSTSLAPPSVAASNRQRPTCCESKSQSR